MKPKSWIAKDVKMLVDALSGKLEPSRKKLKRNLDYPLCDCLTKTPELKYHHKNCKYRMWQERERLAVFAHDIIYLRSVSEEVKANAAFTIMTEQNEELFRD